MSIPDDEGIPDRSIFIESKNVESEDVAAAFRVGRCKGMRRLFWWQEHKRRQRQRLMYLQATWGIGGSEDGWWTACGWW
jgi:hypothetical protein